MTQEELLDFARRKGRGYAFSACDLPIGATRSMMDKTLCVMARAGKIRRIARGIYDIPSYNHVLKRPDAQDMDAVARAIARKNQWTILPCDEAALNNLGLSTQIPARFVYVSDGPSRKYRIGKCVLEFQGRCRRETNLSDRNTRIVVRALKGLGREYATRAMVHDIARKFTDAEWSRICDEAVYVSSWIRDHLVAELNERRDGK